MIEVRTQEELDAAIASGADTHIVVLEAGLCCVVMAGRWIFEARAHLCVVAWENSSVEALENSSVEARGNSSVVARENSSVVARENSSVEAWENSSVEALENSSVEALENSSVVAWENSSVVAWENSSVEAWENSSVEARENVFVRLLSARKISASAQVIVAKRGVAREGIHGGIVIEQSLPRTPEDWCAFYGVETHDGIAFVFKAVGDDYRSQRGGNYSPGALPECDVWQPDIECGGGLHFSPSPSVARAYYPAAKRFVRCGIALTDMAIHPDGEYPGKCAAPRVVVPCVEVDRRGNILVQQDHP